jgi:ribosomal protein S8
MLILFFLSLKSAHKNNRLFFYLKPTKQILELLILLHKLGYVSSFCLLKHNKSKKLIVRVCLKDRFVLFGSVDKLCVFSSFFVQKSITRKNVWFLNHNIGEFFLSTSFGYLTSCSARKLNVGGELMFFIS